MLHPSKLAFRITELRSVKVSFKSYGTAVNARYLNGMHAVFGLEILYAAALVPGLLDALEERSAA